MAGWQNPGAAIGETAGVDEAGRGPLAGPVVVCACCLTTKIEGLRDSKKLSPKKRQELACKIISESIVEVSVISARTIDKINIFQATMHGMRSVVERISKRVEVSSVLIDGNKVPKGLENIATAIIKGDDKIEEIMAASIVAKTLRDHIMVGYGSSMPGYDFEIHKGYGTQKHLKSIEKLGVTRIHRRSYKPCSL